MSAELIAFYQVACYAQEHNIAKIAILTDSFSGLHAISNKKHKNYIIDTFIKKVDKIHFVPGHSNIKSNNIADNAAKTLLWVIYYWILIIPYTMLFIKYLGLFGKNGHKSTQVWHVAEILPITKFFLKRPESFGSIKFQWTQSIIRFFLILSGHCFCKATLAKMKVVAYSLCDDCLIEVSASHIIFNCSKYNNTRKPFPELNEVFTFEDFVVKYGFGSLKTLLDFCEKANIELQTVRWFVQVCET